MLGHSRSPLAAAFLSALAPGLGQIFVGNAPTGVALLCTAAGIGGGVAAALLGPPAFRSWLTAGVLAGIYPFVWFPAVIDAWQAAAGSAKPMLSGHQRWYVILLLLTVGPMSLPLLWQNPRFSQKAKIAWTAAVIGFFILGVLMAVFFLPWLERLIRSVLATGLCARRSVWDC
jgi:hypothetical protein